MLNNATSQLIHSAVHRLTKTERRIAQTLLEEPTLLAFGRVSDLAAKVGTSRPSIVRFATTLGFAGYSDLQTFARQGLSDQLSRPADRIRSDDKAASGEHAQLVSALESVFEAAEEGSFQAFAEQIVAADRVWIATGETSRAGGCVLHSGLSMVRQGVRLIGQHTIASELADAVTGDVAVVFDFQRYRHATILAAQTLASLGATILAITDGPLSPLASMTDYWVEIPVPAMGPFDSSVPAVVVAELLVSQVSRKLKNDARDRIDRIESLWDATNTFES